MASVEATRQAKEEEEEEDDDDDNEKAPPRPPKPVRKGGKGGKMVKKMVEIEVEEEEVEEDEEEGAGLLETKERKKARKEKKKKKKGIKRSSGGGSSSGGDGTLCGISLLDGIIFILVTIAGVLVLNYYIEKGAIPGLNIKSPLPTSSPSSTMMTTTSPDQKIAPKIVSVPASTKATDPPTNFFEPSPPPTHLPGKLEPREVEAPTNRVTPNPVSLTDEFTGKFICYDAQEKTAFGEQMGAIATLLKYHGPSVFRVLDPIKNSNPDAKPESYTNFLDLSLVISRSDKYKLCAETQDGLMGVSEPLKLRMERTHKVVLFHSEKNKIGFTNEIMVPFMEKAVTRGKCPKRDVPKGAVGVNLHISNTPLTPLSDEKAVPKKYCDTLEMQEFKNGKCFIMSDIGKLPCRSDCEYIDTHSSLDMMCNLIFLGHLSKLVMLKNSTLQYVINAEAYIEHQKTGAKFPSAFDVPSQKAVSIEWETHARKGTDKKPDWSFALRPSSRFG